MVKILKTRFAEPAEQLDKLGATKQVKRSQFSGQYEVVSDELLLNWCVKARNLISSACGKDSEHYASFVEAEKPIPYGDSYGIFKRIKAVFTAAREDFEGGYLGKVRNLFKPRLRIPSLTKRGNCSALGTSLRLPWLLVSSLKQRLERFAIGIHLQQASWTK